MTVRSVYQDSREELNDDQELSDEIRRPKTHMTHVKPTHDEVREHSFGFKACGLERKRKQTKK